MITSEQGFEIGRVYQMYHQLEDVREIRLEFYMHALSDSRVDVVFSAVNLQQNDYRTMYSLQIFASQDEADAFKAECEAFYDEMLRNRKEWCGALDRNGHFMISGEGGR